MVLYFRINCVLPVAEGQEERGRVEAVGAHCTARRGACSHRCTAVDTEAAAGAAAAVVLVFEVVELVFAVEWESEPEVVRAVVVEGALNSSCGVLALNNFFLQNNIHNYLIFVCC